MHEASSPIEIRLRKQHARLKPEIRRLVMMCDVLAGSLRSTQHRDAPRLLNELCDSITDIPSELDVRAAAVRVFANDAAASRWLRPDKHANASQTAPSECEPTGRHATESVSLDGIRGICLQYRRTQREMGRFYELCEHFFRKSRANARRSKSRVEESVECDFDQTLWNATGLSIEDVQAAAVRLGLHTQPPQDVANKVQMLASGLRERAVMPGQVPTS